MKDRSASGTIVMPFKHWIITLIDAHGFRGVFELASYGVRDEFFTQAFFHIMIVFDLRVSQGHFLRLLSFSCFLRIVLIFNIWHSKIHIHWKTNVAMLQPAHFRRFLLQKRFSFIFIHFRIQVFEVCLGGWLTFSMLLCKNARNRKPCWDSRDLLTHTIYTPKVVTMLGSTSGDDSSGRWERRRGGGTSGGGPSRGEAARGRQPLPGDPRTGECEGPHEGGEDGPPPYLSGGEGGSDPRHWGQKGSARPLDKSFITKKQLEIHLVGFK